MGVCNPPWSTCFLQDVKKGTSQAVDGSYFASTYGERCEYSPVRDRGPEIPGGTSPRPPISRLRRIVSMCTGEITSAKRLISQQPAQKEYSSTLKWGSGGCRHKWQIRPHLEFAGEINSITSSPGGFSVSQRAMCSTDTCRHKKTHTHTHTTQPEDTLTNMCT